MNLIMNSQDARMLHQPWEPQPATISIKSEGEHQVVRVRYKKSQRKVKIIYEKVFPYSIVSITHLWGKDVLAKLTRVGHAHRLLESQS